MAKLRKALGGVTAVAVPAVPLTLWATGVLPHMRADAVTAWAAWTTAAIALGAAVVGLNQFREMRLTRQEQAQPNVVIYSDANAAVPQIAEIILKNFGATPAYNVKVEVTPPLKATPNFETINKIADVPIPDFPILAPGQEWRTVWDGAIQRKSYMDKLQAEYDKRLWAPCEFNERALFPRHTRRDQIHGQPETASSDGIGTGLGLRDGTTWVDVKTIHDLTKDLDKHLEKQNDVLSAIHRRLAEFGTEHEGVWIYGSGDDDERKHRCRVAEAEAQRRRDIEDRTGLTRLRAQGRQNP
jgi:hypothetical protein